MYSPPICNMHEWVFVPKIGDQRHFCSVWLEDNLIDNLADLCYSFASSKEERFFFEPVRIRISPAQCQPRRTVLGMWNKAITQLNILWEQDAFYTRTIVGYGYHRWVNIERAVKPFSRYALDLSVLSFVFVVGAYIFFPTIANADPLQ